MYHLRQSDGVLDKPFFHVISTGEMEKADTFSRRLRELAPLKVGPGIVRHVRI